MKNNIIKIGIVCLAIFSFYGTAHATLNVDTTVDVPVSCSVTDTNGLVHNYATGSYLGICALEKALEQNVVSDIDFVDFGFGLFINSVNNISQNNTYWQLRLNNVSASVGASDLTLQAGDIVSLVLTAFDPITFAETSLGDQVTLHIHFLVIPLPAVGSAPLTTSDNSVTPTTITPVPVVQSAFDVKKALDFLTAQQKDDGSFGESLYTDWTAIALASGNNQGQVLKLVKYFGGAKIDGTLLTDFERRAMSLMTLGLNPYATNGENYIEKITSSFDGKQFGDPNEDNDDIFALIVLSNAGYTENDQMIKNDISFVLNAQNENGSWNNSVDMTGAAVEALSAFSPTPGIGESLEKAKNFLKQNQKDNGSWNNNASSTAWVLEGILALGEKPEDWVKSGNSPLDYLASVQDTDGGIKNDNLKNKIWETAYVASALSGKTWSQIMQKFEKTAMPIAAEIPKEMVQNQTTNTVVVINSPLTKANSAKNVKPKLKNLANQNTATALSAVQNAEISAPAQPARKNWLMRLLDSIFRF